MDVMPQKASPFNECVVLATICGRSLFHAQQYSVRFVYGDLAPNWIDQHQWLDNVLTNRLQILSQYYPSPAQICDPLISFAHIMGQASVIHLYKGIESAVWTVDKEAWVLEYQRRAFSAAQEIVKLAKGLTEFNFFKVYQNASTNISFIAERLVNEFSDSPPHAHSIIALCGVPLRQSWLRWGFQFATSRASTDLPGAQECQRPESKLYRFVRTFMYQRIHRTCQGELFCSMMIT
jgi:hypothetical protein